MKNTLKTFLILSLLILVSSCMQKFPTVKVLASKWDPNTNAWAELKSDGLENVNNKTYIYGQRFSGTTTGNSFTKKVGPVDELDSSKGDIIRIYNFDGKTWSKDSIIGLQSPLDDKYVLDDSINQLYAYYTSTDVPENDFAWQWELVDPSQYIYITDGYEISSYTGAATASSWSSTTIQIDREEEYNKSLNAHLTKGMSSPVNGSGRTVNAPIPTRRGYKFMGWTTSPIRNNNQSASARVNLPDVEYPASSTFNLHYKDGYIKGQTAKKTTLYALWYPDYENGYWAKIDNEFVPDTFNLSDHKNIAGFTPVGKYATNPNYFVDYPQYYEVHYPSKGLTSLAQYDRNDARIYTFDYDFAIGDIEFTAYTLEKLREWNNKLPADKQFSLPIYPSGSYHMASNNNSSYPQVPTDDKNYINIGYYYQGGHAQQSSYYSYVLSMPLTGTHVYQPIIIANAMTAYYNDHNGSGEDLTFAYKNEDGSYIRTIAECVTFWTTTSNNGSWNPRADITATGFRLPTIYEFSFAASVMPKATTPTNYTQNNIRWTNSKYKGSSFPQFQAYWQPSGSLNRAVPHYGSTSSVSEGNIAPEVWYKYSSTYDADNGSHYSVRGFVYVSERSYPGNPGFVTSKGPNFSGVYNMTGNTYQLHDTISSSTSNYYKCNYSGGAISSCYIYHGSTTSPTATRTILSFRFARTINHLK